MTGEHPCLLAAAAPREVAAVLDGLGAGGRLPDPWAIVPVSSRVHVLRTGVGKANAAGALGSALARRRYGVLVSIGLAGALPDEDGSFLPLGTTVLADPCVFADEGSASPDGFKPLSAMGFPAHEAFSETYGNSAAARSALSPLVDLVGACATVSTCSGSDALASAVATRTGAIGEDMESAAAGLVAARCSVPFASLRVISNTTGDRGRQAWDLEGALRVMGALASRL